MQWFYVLQDAVSIVFMAAMTALIVSVLVWAWKESRRKGGRRNV